MLLIIPVLVLLLFLWSALLWGYTEQDDSIPIEPDLARVFDPKCLPIELVHSEPSTKAIIMVHGFPSTPYTYHWAAKEAYKQGYDVFVPLLPGFGTAVEDLYNTTFSQWFAYLQKVYETKRGAYEHLFVVGTSMGGSMALKLAQKFNSPPLQPDAICTIGAPVFLNDITVGVIQKWGYYLMRLVALFTPALSPAPFAGSENKNDGEELWVGYKGSFVKGGVSFMYALKTIRKDLPYITAPLIAMHDKRDKTISSKNLEVITSSVSSEHVERISTEMQSNHNRHILLSYPSIQHPLLQNMLQFFNQFCSGEPQ